MSAGESGTMAELLDRLDPSAVTVNVDPAVETLLFGPLNVYEPCSVKMTSEKDSPG